MTVFIIFQIIILLFSIVIHEVAHGYTAESLGDPTARMAGRLTLNPIKHIDVFGSIIVPLLLVISSSPFIIGWAKPVPYNPNLLTKDRKYGPLKVALAGPLVNLAIAVFFGLILRATFNLIPQILVAALGIIVFINILLGVFNLIPIPPLDGSKILTVILPPKYSMKVQRIGLIGIFLVFIFLIYFGSLIFAFTGILFKLISGQAAWQTLLLILAGGF